jgi:hypothetical protein
MASRPTREQIKKRLAESEDPTTDQATEKMMEQPATTSSSYTNAPQNTTNTTINKQEKQVINRSGGSPIFGRPSVGRQQQQGNTNYKKHTMIALLLAWIIVAAEKLTSESIKGAAGIK